MIEGCLLLVWVFLVLTWLVWETWLRHVAGEGTGTDDNADQQIKCSMEDCEISGREGGEEKSEGVAPLDGTAFSLKELHFQLKQMESMIKMLLPYKEKLEAMHQLPSTETTSKLDCGSGDVSLSDLCNRLKVLESENQSLLIENGNQRLKFERCLDQVAIHVAHVLLAQQTLRGECLHLHQRVVRLEQQNQQLYKFFQHQLASLRQSKEQETQSPPEHIYEIPEFFHGGPGEECTKVSPGDKCNTSSSMYDSIEAGFPSALCSASWNPVATTSNQIQFGVRSQTIPPYTSPRSRARCTIDAGCCCQNYHLATRNKPSSKKVLHSEFERLEDFESSGLQKKGSRARSEVVDHSVSAALEKEPLGIKHPAASVCRVETNYSNLLPENMDKGFACKSMESSVNDADLSPAAELLRLSDSFYEQFTISDHGGQLSMSKKRNEETEEFCTESDDKEMEEFCTESDDTQSFFHGSDHLTRASSISLSELLGRTPNITSDSDTLSFDDYPFLDCNAQKSVIEENSNEDSDYEELIVEDSLPKSHRGVFRSDIQTAPLPPDVRITETLSPCGLRQKTLLPSRERNTESPPGVRNMRFCGHRNLVSPTSACSPTQVDHSGPHINALSRCSNKKLKSAADKIFSAGYRVRPVKPYHEDSDRNSNGSTSPLDCVTSKESGHHLVSSEKDCQIQNRPSFLKISSLHRHSAKSPADGRKQREDLSPAFLPSGEFLWDDRFLVKSDAVSSPHDRSMTTSHSYVNISALNLKQKPRPLLARRKMNPPNAKAVAQSFSKRGCSRSVDIGVQHSSSKTGFLSVGSSESATRALKKLKHGENRLHSSSLDSSPDSDVQQSVFTSSSDSDTITGEKLPSSQDDGYSSNSLPSETSSRQPMEAGRLRRSSKRDEQNGFMKRRNGGIVKIVPIMGSREDLLTFEESCEKRSELDSAEIDLKMMTLEDSVEDLSGNSKPHPFSTSNDAESHFVEETDSSHEELLILAENSASETPVQEFLNGNDEE